MKLLGNWDWDCNTFLDNYADYSLAANLPQASGLGEATSAAVGAPPPVADDPKKDVMVTPGADIGDAAALGKGTVMEEKIEYRDENGVLLDEEQVKALEGKVSFSTRYETRTRVVDEAGNELSNELVDDGGEADEAEEEEDEGVRGTLAEGSNPETTAAAGEVSDSPAAVEVGDDLEKERVVDDEAGVAEPEAEGSAEVTDSRDEL